MEWGMESDIVAIIDIQFHAFDKTAKISIIQP